MLKKDEIKKLDGCGIEGINRKIGINTTMDINTKMNLSTGVIQKHYDEWAVGSGIQREIIEENVLSKKDVAYLLGWSCKCDSGWWVHGIDPASGNDRTFGQFKPDQPVIMGGKPAKYLTPSFPSNFFKE